jgi:hypothetical protein
MGSFTDGIDTDGLAPFLLGYTQELEVCVSRSPDVQALRAFAAGGRRAFAVHRSGQVHGQGGLADVGRARNQIGVG